MPKNKRVRQHPAAHRVRLLRPRARRRRLRRQRTRKLGRLITACFILWALIAAFYAAWAWTFDLQAVGRIPESSLVLDHHGKVYTRLAGENRRTVPLSKVSPWFVRAVIAREDTRFLQHFGVDPVGIIRAAVSNIAAGGVRQGGSTLTQQLARNSFPLGGQTIHRKILEAALAMRMESVLSKDDILTHYMNRIYFGAGLFGVETASQAYFGKPAADMSLAESALLAGIIRSPNRLSPFRDPEGAMQQRNLTLRQMEHQGFISEQQCAGATQEPLILARERPAPPQEDWAMELLWRELERVLPQDVLDSAGLKIHTTLDNSMQRTAVQAVEAQLTAVENREGYPHPRKADVASIDPKNRTGTPYLQACAMALDSRTGGIRALVGGRDYSASKYNRAYFAERQVGSSVKPFVYAVAFAGGMQPDAPISDDRIGPGELPKAFGAYNPANSDDTYRGALPAKEGLVLSRNTMSVRVGTIAGLERVRDGILAAGLSRDVPRFPSIFLGSFSGTLKALTTAYAALANDGVTPSPHILDSVEDAQGRVLYRYKGSAQRILPAKAARMTADVLAEAMTRGTGAVARSFGYRGHAAGKTGTTNDYRDAWFIGFDAETTCGVWVGFDQPKKIVERGYGATLALPIWVKIMNASDAER
ncbi:MAG: PBP1A family penicillin-binding protein [Chthoniobacterales bacterium]|nr:PBP1A family penicillin-binding protein [Chthoniobacterales bacterium]